MDTIATVIETFGEYSGLTINWDKSLLMPIDDPTHSCKVPQIPLVSSSLFKYLGIQISTSLSQYDKFNLEPLLAKLKLKLQVWRKLHISIVGRINLLKII